MIFKLITLLKFSISTTILDNNIKQIIVHTNIDGKFILPQHQLLHILKKYKGTEYYQINVKNHSLIYKLSTKTGNWIKHTFRTILAAVAMTNILVAMKTSQQSTALINNTFQIYIVLKTMPAKIIPIISKIMYITKIMIYKRNNNIQSFLDTIKSLLKVWTNTGNIMLEMKPELEILYIKNWE